MFRVFSLFLLILFCCFSYPPAGKAQNGALPDTDGKSLRVVQLTRQKKYKEALPLAKEVVSQREKEFGKDHPEVARAERNLGFINYFLKDFSKADKSFSRAIKIYDRQTDPDSETIELRAELYKFRALSNHFRGKTEEAFEIFQKSIELFNLKAGENSLEAAQIYVQMGNIRSSLREYGKASENYKKALEIRSKKLGAADYSAQDAFDRCVCALKKDDRTDQIENLRLTFYPGSKLNEHGMLEPEEKAEKSSDKARIGENTESHKEVINGRAIRLPKPVFPPYSRSLNARGTVFVHTKINGRGIVTFACGAFSKTLKTFISAAENAAYRARFEPTLLDGKEIRVAGIIEYRFN